MPSECEARESVLEVAGSDWRVSVSSILRPWLHMNADLSWELRESNGDTMLLGGFKVIDLHAIRLDGKLTEVKGSIVLPEVRDALFHHVGLVVALLGVCEGASCC